MYIVVTHDPGECQNPHYWVVNSSSGNWLGKSGNKPLPEPMLNHGPISRRIFRRDSNSRENLWFLCNAIIGYHIATKLYTCHDSTAVVPCAKFHSDHFHWKSDDSRIEFPSNLHQHGWIVRREMGPRSISPHGAIMLQCGMVPVVALYGDIELGWHWFSPGVQLIPCHLTTPIHYLN